MAADTVLLSRIILNCGLKHCTSMGKHGAKGEKVIVGPLFHPYLGFHHFSSTKLAEAVKNGGVYAHAWRKERRNSSTAGDIFLASLAFIAVAWI